MARLRTDGAVFGRESSTATVDYENHRGGVLAADTPHSAGTVDVSSDAAIVRSGERYCYATPAGSTGYRRVLSVGGVLGRNYYGRAYFRFSGGNPSALVRLLQFATTGSAVVGELRITPTGTLRLVNAAIATIGSESAAVDLDRWYRAELRVWQDPVAPDTTNGTIEARLYDDTETLIWSEGSTATDARTTAVTEFRSGPISGGPFPGAFHWSTIALNDDQDVAQNTWPGPGKLVALMPVADYLIPASFTGGAGGTANLFEALNNLPPQGVAAATPPTDASQVKAAAGTAAQADFEVGAYSDSLASGGGGMAAGDTVRVVRAVCRIANEAAVAAPWLVAAASNPVVLAGAAANTIGSAMGSDLTDPPVNWRTISSTFGYDPVVTLSTRPQVRIRRNNTFANVQHCDLAALIVEYEPAPAAGSAHTHDAADSSELGDAVSKATAVLAAEAPSLMDFSAGAAALSKADPLALEDAALGVWEALRLVDDAASASDAHVGGAGKGISDSAVSTDGVSKVGATAHEESMAVADSGSRAPGKRADETIPAADASLAALALLTSELLALTDSQVREAEYGRSAEDSTGLADSSLRAPGLRPAEAIAVAEALVREMGLTRAEVVAPSEIVSKAVARSLADPVTLADAVARAIALARTEGVEISDDVLPALARAIIEALGAIAHGRAVGAGHAVGVAALVELIVQRSVTADHAVELVARGATSQGPATIEEVST